MPVSAASDYTAAMNRDLPMHKIFLPVAFVLVLAACGNKGPLILAPPPSAADAELMQADAVDDSGAVADPTPTDTEQMTLPPDNPPVEVEPEPVPDDGNG